MTNIKKTKEEILKELEKEEQKYENIQYIKADKTDEENFKKIVKMNISKRKVINIRPLESDIAKIKSKALSV
jgi:predicted DNA binding CopG/RHH family protein